MTTSGTSEHRERIQVLLERTRTELLDAQERAESGSLRDAHAEMTLRAKLFGLRSELAALDQNDDLSMKLAKSEANLSREARQIAKHFIADELAELRAYVLEGSVLEDALDNLPEKLTECGPGPNGSEVESSTSSSDRSGGGSSTSP